MTKINMQPFSIIYSNFPHCKEWQDDSFMGNLHENCIINYEKYWLLEWAILQVTPMDKTKDARHLLWPLFNIFSRSMELFMAHSSREDGYSIVNIDDYHLSDFAERFILIFEGFFKGELPSPAAILSYEERNPLLELD
ncbi:hypothetical protein D8I35_01560 [Corticibacter populi]|uniref:Uncharacterized protein n=1 Tax=Corticibacter populi TaxID=1550736 RepID=A0A3M6QY47_9BURK|nr:Imm41 family immunity protein [Corticibacter populi]RMX07841.1 hypothetical protein D8I35_01560 [Corticibacter populi]RZS35076.1 immunity protein 41 of polymorphic toxin system [Corticibacter populi]